MNPDPDTIERILPARLERTFDRAAQTGCALILGLITGVVGFGALAAWKFTGLSEEKDSWVALVVGIAFAAVSLLLLYSALHQYLSSGIPTTIVELSTNPVPRGTPIEICVRQPGPVNLRSLRANLLCLEQEKKEVKDRRPGRPQYSFTEKLIYQENIVDGGARRILASEVAGERSTFVVPEDQPSSHTDPATDERGELTYVWRIEIWGKVAGRTGFMHPFDLKVV